MAKRSRNSTSSSSPRRLIASPAMPMPARTKRLSLARSSTKNTSTSAPNSLRAKALRSRATSSTTWFRTSSVTRWSTIIAGMISARIAPAPSTPSAITKARAKSLTTTRSRPRRKIWPSAASRLPRVRLNGSATIAPTYLPKTTRMAGTTRSISSKARRIRITPAKSLASATWKRLAKSRKTSSSASSDLSWNNEKPFLTLGSGFFLGLSG